MPTIPDPYDRTEFRDRLLDYATAAATVQVEVVLGYRLTLMQGVGGAAASSGTHLGRKGADGRMEGGRATDLAPYDGRRKSKVHRDIGFCSWEREALAGVWPEHVHNGLMFITRDNKRGAADSLVAQFGKYDRGEDGLANPPTPDPWPYRPSPKVVFTLEQYRHIMSTVGLAGGPLPTPVTKVRDALVQEDYDVGLIIAMIRGLPDHDSDANRRWVKQLQKDRVGIRRILDQMAKR